MYICKRCIFTVFSIIMPIGKYDMVIFDNPPVQMSVVAIILISVVITENINYIYLLDTEVHIDLYMNA